MLFSAKPKYDYIVTGLGNPGAQYDATRHNAGFRTIDRLTGMLSAGPERKKHNALLYEAVVNGRKILLIKPLTFMNNSGEAVSEIAKFYKISYDRLIVISDDVSMDAGRLRIRKSGSHGGHNGLKSVIELCGTDRFTRIRIGVGQKPHPDYDLADWVLGKPAPCDAEKITLAETQAAKAVTVVISEGADTAMNQFNR